MEIDPGCGCVMDWDGFFQVHKGLHREGPGLPEDVHWALAQTGVQGAIDALDAGCGPGADLEVFAEALPSARLTGVEKTAQFVAEAQDRLASFGDRVTVCEADMAEPGGPYDLIWCAGALYFLGVTEGLTAWRSALKAGGWVAFSEPVLLPGIVSDEEAAFWDGYPRTDLAGISARIEAAGYRMAEHRLIIGPAWDAYYTPMRRRIATLRAAGNPELGTALDENEREADLWAAAQDRIAYALVLAQPC